MVAKQGSVALAPTPGGHAIVDTGNGLLANLPPAAT